MRAAAVLSLVALPAAFASLTLPKPALPVRADAGEWGEWGEERAVFKLHTMYDCPEVRGRRMRFRWQDASIVRLGRTAYAVNGDLCAETALQGDWRGSVTVEYQENEDDGNRARLFFFETKSVCNDTLVKYRAKMEEMAKHIQGFTPRCPIQPGCYRVTNLEFEAEGVSQMLCPGFSLITVHGYMDNELIWCSTIVFKCELE